jgi:protein-S-isoprenylcysteine O-methyltransferase Ste14
MRQIAAILLLPGIVTGAIPAVIVYQSRVVRLGWSLPWPANLLLAAFGLLLIGAGSALMYSTIRLFATAGHGTLAPWEPPQRLVVRGVYRHIRNPMILGVFLVLLGEAAFFGLSALLYWLLMVVALNVVYIPVLEEPGLEQRFGDDYKLYKRNVPRWIPRWHAWQPPWEQRAP